MVLVFIVAEESRGAFSSQFKLQELNYYFHKNNLQGQDIYFYSISQFSPCIAHIVEEGQWTVGGSRSMEDFESLLPYVQEHLTNQLYGIVLASTSDIDGVHRAYSIHTQLPEDYDILILSWDGSAYNETVTSLVGSYNPGQNLGENVRNYITRDIFPEAIDLETDLLLSSCNVSGDLAVTKKKLATCCTLAQGFRKPQAGRRNESLEKIMREIQEINQVLEACKGAAEKISREFKATQNQASYDSVACIKYATSFTPDQITITQVQSQDHRHYILTIVNNTSYHWDDLVVYIPETSSNLFSRVGLKPYETITKEAEFDYELLQQRGVFTFKVMFGSHVISNDCAVQRIILTGLRYNGEGYEVYAMNSFINIKDCILVWLGQDGVQHELATSFTNFSESRIFIQDIRQGDQISLAVYAGELALSSTITFEAN